MMDELTRLHNVEIEILDYIVDLCNKNGLQYCLIYGSALGSYRHSGFIPWDDDIDVAIPEKDYERLKEIIYEDDDPRFVFQDMYSENDYYMLFGKVRKRNTLFIESISEKKLNENGIYVDIFPLYRVQKNKVNTNIINYFKHIIKFTTHKNLYKQKYTPLKYLVSCFISIPAAIMTPKKVLIKLNNFIKKNVDSDGKFLAEFDENGNIQVIDAEIYFPTKMMRFGEKEYCVPGRIEDYLITAYGENYMQLPPENERHTHAPDRIDFGD